jgi:hypothetical protein
MEHSAARPTVIRIAAVSIAAAGAFACALGMPAAAFARDVVAVLTIGCPSDGQQGPQPAPANGVKQMPLDPAAATALAYYITPEQVSVLAPRGWYCIGFEGSNGSSIYVTPEPIDTEAFFTGAWKGVAGPGVQTSISFGDTSGRFEVARVAARIFPDARKFVQGVIAEGIDHAADFPAGPYADDRMTRLTPRAVEFETPPHAEGLGTMSRFLPGDDPISGVAMLVGNPPDLVMSDVRLAPGMREFSPVIIHQAERDYEHGPTP